MKKILILFVLWLLSALTAFSQTVTLTFTGRDANNQHLPMDRVVIANATQGWQETIYWPDTVFTMGSTGIADNAANGDFCLRQNNPNPFTGTTYATLQTMDASEVILEMTDVNGRIVETQNFASLQPGDHQFRINVATAGIYFLTARQNGQASSIKMVNNGQGATNRIEYQNFVDTRNNNVETWRTASLQENNAKTNAKGVATHPFTLGDDMIYTGYVTVNGTEYQSQMIHQNQFVSENFVLNFNVSVPMGLPTVTTNAPTNVGVHSATCGGNVTADGGYGVLARGVCWSTSQNPTIADSHTTDGSGTGSFTSSMTGLVAGTTYYVRAYAVNSVETAYGNQVIFTTAVPCGISTVTDFDNNTYNTVQIGNQCWMKENLRTTHYADGTPIPLGNGISYNIAYRYYPNNNNSNVSTYGYLYNWPAVMGNFTSSSANPSGVQGICPAGWHVPSDAEWMQLTDYVGSQIQYVCGGDNTYIAKALASTTGWDSDNGTCVVGNNPSANNATGFSAVPAGFYYSSCYDFGGDANFWSATQYGSYAAYGYSLAYLTAIVTRADDTKGGGFSVRCLRNVESSSETLPTVTTNTVTGITENSATCGGNVTADGGYGVIAKGVCWSTSPNPVFNDSHVSCGDSMGSFTCQITGLEANTTYYVRAYAVNSMGTAYGNQVSFTTTVGPVDGQPCPGTPTVTDHQGNIYNTVQIGEQCWTRENMRCTTSPSTGTTILEATPTSSYTGKKAYYVVGSSSNTSTYGLLYNWNAAVDTFNTAYGETSTNTSSSNAVNVTFSGNRRGICPQGWHVPSDAEWTQLTDYVSSQSEYVCGSNNTYIAKALASTTGWRSSLNTCAVGNNPSANNAAGFSALPAGNYDGGYYLFRDYALFWSDTPVGSNGAYYRYFYCYYEYVTRNTNVKYDGFSVRCLRD